MKQKINFEFYLIYLFDEEFPDKLYLNFLKEECLFAPWLTVFTSNLFFILVMIKILFNIPSIILPFNLILQIHIYLLIDAFIIAIIINQILDSIRIFC